MKARTRIRIAAIIALATFLWVILPDWRFHVFLFRSPPGCANILSQRKYGAAQLTHGGLLDTIEHPNQCKYADQRIFIVEIENYAYIVPFAEDESTIFLKTIIPSGKMTKRYLRGDEK